jgi:hypothetical protein
MGFLLATLCVAALGPAQGQGRAKPAANLELPAPVQEIVDAIRAAVSSGDIEDLSEPWAWNELKPDLGTGPVADPILHWRAQSKDGSGRETLDQLDALLSEPPAVVPLGRDLENNRLYVWPAFAETALTRLTPGQQRQFERLASPAQARADMLSTGRYRGPRLVIGADGTWHRFSVDP